MTNDEKKRLIAEKMREILLILGLDLSTPSLSSTPQRIAKMYVEEIFSGLDPENLPQMIFQEEACHELILVKNISFVSYCEHHFVPFIGKAHVAYYSNKKVVGLSKIARLVRYFAQRPQLQERLTQQIAQQLISFLESADVAVVLQATHFCMMTRGVEDLSTEMETHALHGRLEKDPLLRAEFFARIHN